MKLILALIAAVASTGCAYSGPGLIGNGEWMQFLENGHVVAEYNTRDAGHMACISQVNQHRLRNAQCAHAPSTESLPYSYTVLNKSNESDGIKPSSPYTWRLATSARCQRGLASQLALPKVVVLKANCN
jgi:hypothetical protein